MESSSSYFCGDTGGVLLVRLGGEFTRNSIGTKTKRKTDADGELDVFGAEKYFSGGMDGDEQLVKRSHENNNIPRKSSSSSPAPEATCMIPSRRISSSGTPTSSSSETSCGHSRETLLPDAKKSSSGSPQKPLRPGAGKTFFSIFRCSCVSSSSKKSRELKSRSCRKTGCNNIGETGRMQRNTKLGTSGAVVGAKKENYNMVPLALTSEKPLEEERKASRRFTTLGNEALNSCGLRRGVTTSATLSSGAGRDSDVCSESSSDLFEIEHLAVDKRPIGTGSGASATLCYESSEESVEWTITTASGAADFSLASDSERSPTEAGKAKASPQRRRPAQLSDLDR